MAWPYFLSLFQMWSNSTIEVMYKSAANKFTGSSPSTATTVIRTFRSVSDFYRAFYYLYIRIDRRTEQPFSFCFDHFESPLFLFLKLSFLKQSNTHGAMSTFSSCWLGGGIPLVKQRVFIFNFWKFRKTATSSLQDLRRVWVLTYPQRRWQRGGGYIHRHLNNRATTDGWYTRGRQQTTKTGLQDINRHVRTRLVDDGRPSQIPLLFLFFDKRFALPAEIFYWSKYPERFHSPK